MNNKKMTPEQEYTYNVCNTIANQMGGQRFIDSTKATPAFYTTVHNDPALVYDLPESCEYSRMIIIYMRGIDTYKMGFINRSDGSVKTYDDVYCDQLQDIFTEATGISTADCRVIFC